MKYKRKLVFDIVWQFIITLANLVGGIYMVTEPHRIPHWLIVFIGATWILGGILGIGKLLMYTKIYDNISKIEDFAKRNNINLSIFETSHADEETKDEEIKE